MLLAVGAIPGMTEPSPAAGGFRFIDAWVPSVIVISLAMLALQSIPGAVATYREQGVLRRLATTPVHPANLLGAQLLIHVVIALAGIGLTLGVAHAAYDVPMPKHPLMFLLTLLLGTVSMFSFGLLAAAVARTAKAAGGIAMIAFMPTMFFGGVYLPRPLLPEVLQPDRRLRPAGHATAAGRLGRRGRAAAAAGRARRLRGARNGVGGEALPLGVTRLPPYW